MEPVIVQIATRVEQSIADALQEIATREKRSLSAQLALILETYIAEQLAAD